MEVANCLASVVPAVDDKTKSVFGQAFGCRDPAGGQNELTRHVGVRFLQNVQAPNVATRDHQDMGGRLGVDIPEGQEVVIAVDLGTWYFPFSDIAKQAVIHGIPFHLGEDIIS